MFKTATEKDKKRRIKQNPINAANSLLVEKGGRLLFCDALIKNCVYLSGWVCLLKHVSLRSDTQVTDYVSHPNSDEGF